MLREDIKVVIISLFFGFFLWVFLDFCFHLFSAFWLYFRFYSFWLRSVYFGVWFRENRWALLRESRFYFLLALCFFLLELRLNDFFLFFFLSLFISLSLCFLFFWFLQFFLRSLALYPCESCLGWYDFFLLGFWFLSRFLFFFFLFSLLFLVWLIFIRVVLVGLLCLLLHIFVLLWFFFFQLFTCYLWLSFSILLNIFALFLLDLLLLDIFIFLRCWDSIFILRRSLYLFSSWRLFLLRFLLLLLFLLRSLSFLAWGRSNHPSFLQRFRSLRFVCFNWLFGAVLLTHQWFRNRCFLLIGSHTFRLLVVLFLLLLFFLSFYIWLFRLFFNSFLSLTII